MSTKAKTVNALIRVKSIEGWVEFDQFNEYNRKARRTKKIIKDAAQNKNKFSHNRLLMKILLLLKVTNRPTKKDRAANMANKIRFCLISLFIK